MNKSEGISDFQDIRTDIIFHFKNLKLLRKTCIYSFYYEVCFTPESFKNYIYFSTYAALIFGSIPGTCHTEHNKEVFKQTAVEHFCLS